MARMTKARFPGSVYGTGEEPDPRFSMANERTFLAWIRTSLAFIAGGVALETFDLPLNTMRHARPLPASPALALIVGVVIIIGLMILVGELLA